MLVGLVADVPATVVDPIVVTATGMAAFTTVQLWREVGNKQEWIAEMTGDAAQVAEHRDFTYPLGVDVTYIVQPDNFRAGPFFTPTSAFPIIRDLFAPELLTTFTTIVDVRGRSYGGRVTVYRVVARKFPITYGDIRQASEGQLVLFCGSHAERDRVIATLSSGGPCALRVPPECHGVVDDMYFTPINVSEERFGTNGKCVLTVDFVEVDGTDVPQFAAVTYGEQTTNANDAGMMYRTLSENFAGYTYADLYLSPNGITVS